MRSLAIGVVVLAASFAACQTKSTLPSPRVGLRITNPEVARQHSRHSQHLDLPFLLPEHGVNGTGVLLAYLQRLQAYGVAYATDVSYALQMTYGGKAVECVSKIAVDDGTRAAAPAAAPEEAEGEAEYTTRIKPWRPRTTTAWVVDRDMVCKQHAQQVASDQPVYDTTFNAELAHSMFARTMPTEGTQIVFYDACEYQPSRRFVQRYEHFVVARFSPPDLAMVARSYADFPLVAEPPLCHEIKLAPGQALRQHIEADVHFAAPIVPHLENEILLVEPVQSVGGEG